MVGQEPYLLFTLCQQYFANYCKLVRFADVKAKVMELKKLEVPSGSSGRMLLDYLNLDYDICGLLYDILASCFLSFLISFISSDT